MKRKIICTSSGCIEQAPERYRDLGIDIIRLHVIFEGKDYLEGKGLDNDAFYARLETLEDPKNNLPKTSMPSPDDIMACFDKAVADGYDEALVFTLSTGLSGTYELISNIAKEYADKIKITVVNTKNNSFNEGFLAIKAQEFVNAGMSTEDILKEINWMIDRQEFMAVDGKLDYLIYNGRLKGGKAFFGKMLSICPVVYFNREGNLVPLESVRTQKKALARMCEIIKEKIGDRSPEDYLLWHVYTGPSLLEKLKEIEGKYGVECNHEDVIMSAVSGCHNGPWLAGYGYMPLRRPDEEL
ncbi:MAG: DegV family protein [Clostridia bacterium]|nr:DegV family protein [Clostridia bacterium]